MAERAGGAPIPIRRGTPAYRRHKTRLKLGLRTGAGQLVLSDRHGRPVDQLTPQSAAKRSDADRDPLLTNKSSVVRSGRRRLYDLLRTAVRHVPDKGGPKALPHCQHKAGYEALPDGTMQKRTHVQVRVTEGESGRCTARFAGILRCGSVWCCPVCADKISRNRGEELRAALKMHLEAGGGALFITLTIRHGLFDGLKYLRTQILSGPKNGCAGALRRLRQDKKARAWFKALDTIGDVRALEVTHGLQHGWHPHLHLVVFTHKPVSAEFEKYLAKTNGSPLQLYDRWAHCVEKAGLQRPVRYSQKGEPVGVHVEVVRSAKIGEYVAKFGIASELTSTLTKAGRDGNRNIWQLLNDLHQEIDVERDGRLWAEWCVGMKGARQLSWSPKLRKHFGLGPEPDDEDLVYLHDDEGEIVAQIDRPEFEFYAPIPGWRIHVLEIAEQYGGSGVMEFMARCRRDFTDRSKPPPWWLKIRAAQLTERKNAQDY